MKSFVIKRMGYIISQVEGDYNLAVKWYKTKAKYYNCFFYPSSIDLNFDVSLSCKHSDKIFILLGNSASESNNHIVILAKLAKFKTANIEL